MNAITINEGAMSFFDGKEKIQMFGVYMSSTKMICESKTDANHAQKAIKLLETIRPDLITDKIMMKLANFIIYRNEAGEATLKERVVAFCGLIDTSFHF